MTRNLRLFILLVILVGLPAITWYILDKGISFRKDIAANWVDRGKIPSDSLTNRTIDTTLAVNKISVLFYIPKSRSALSDSARMTLGKIIDRLQVDAQAENNIHVFECLGQGTDSVQSIGASSSYWHRIPCDSAMEWKVRMLYQQAQSLTKADGNHAIILDRSLHLRNTYDLTEGSEINNLIKHVALNMAPPKRR